MGKVNAGFVGDDGKKINLYMPPESKTRETNETLDYSVARKTSQIVAAQAAAFSTFLLGTAFGWSSPVQPQLQQQSLLNIELQNSTWYINLDDDQMSWVGSLMNIGALFGSLSGGFLMDKFGRRFILMTMAIPYTIGWIFITFALNPSMLYIGRIIVGYAGGACSTITPCYIGEISTPTMRGIVGVFFSLNLCLGLLVTSLMGLWLNWRWISGICTLLPLLFVLCFFSVPESPYFLVKKGRTDDAIQALKWLRGINYNNNAELLDIKARIEHDKNQTIQITDMFRPWAYKPIVVGVVLMFLQQFSGMNAVQFNAAEIFRVADTKVDRLVGVILINLVQVIAVLVSCVLVERLDRRTILAFTEGLACISIFALGLFFYVNEEETPGMMAGLTWLPLTSLIVFFLSMGIGVGPLPWVVASEILPAKLRGPGNSINSFANFATAFIVTKTFVDMQREMSHAGVFWFYSSVSFVGILFCHFILPETKGRSPDQIESLFIDSKTSVLNGTST